jgi:hypothetical protein
MRRLFCAATLAAFVLAMPLAAFADDQDIADGVANALEASGQMRDYKVGVKVQDGTAWLKGTVASQQQMTTAEMIAKSCYGVDRVVNNLTIGSSNVAGQPGMMRSGLRQPDSIGGGNAQMAGMRNNGVVRASMELPDHAQQELQVAGPQPQTHDDMPMAARLNPSAPMQQPMPMQQGAPGEPQAYPMNGRQAQPMPPAANRRPLPMGARGPYQQVAQHVPGGPEAVNTPRPMVGQPIGAAAPAPMHYDNPQMPGYAWPSYAAYPNYAALTYPKQYSPTAWPYIGPFYPYPQVPLGWRKVTLEWDDGWWFLDFKDSH